MTSNAAHWGDSGEPPYLKHPVDKVWAAVTEPALLIGWLAEAEVEPTPGGLVQLRWLNVKEPGQEILAKGTVTVFDPPHLVEYNTDIHGRLRFELREDGEGCLLTFTCTIQLPTDHRLMNIAGWHIHLEHLANALEGRAVEWPTWWSVHYPRWQQLHDRYKIARG
jgi:uncharacterized protein YndB with AHSA1/START domain